MTRVRYKHRYWRLKSPTPEGLELDIYKLAEDIKLIMMFFQIFF